MIEISSGDLRATVDPHGAYVCSLSFGGGSNQDLVYPKQTITNSDGSVKIRGGSHICFPNFGPDPTGGFLQHGIGRVTRWNVQEQATSTVLLSLPITSELANRLKETQPGVVDYVGVAISLRYSIAADPYALVMQAIVTNQSARPLRVSPGFHPYFTLPKGETAERVLLVTASGESEQKSFVGACNPSYEVNFDPQSNLTAQFQNGTKLSFGGVNLSKVTYWSDDPRKFICIEPTAFGSSFTRPPLQEEVLPVGAEREYTVTVRWSL